MLTFQTLLVIFVALYLVAMISIGVWSSRKVKNEYDYLTASQSIGPWVGGASLAATQMSAGTYIGLIGTHYLFGNAWIWVWPGIWFGYLITVVVVAPRMRAFAQRSGGMTVPDFISARYNSTWVRGIAAVLIVATYTLMMGAQYQGGGVMLETLLGVPAICGHRGDAGRHGGVRYPGRDARHRLYRFHPADHHDHRHRDRAPAAGLDGRWLALSGIGVGDHRAGSQCDSSIHRFPLGSRPDVRHRRQPGVPVHLLGGSL